MNLILLPGLDGTDIFFEPLLAALPDWIKPIIITYPSHGTNTYDELLALIYSRIDHLPHYIILGWSFSGPLALRVATSRVQQTRGVILCASFVSSPKPNLLRWRWAITTPTVWLIRVCRRVKYKIKGGRSDALQRAKTLSWNRVSAHVLAQRAKIVLKVDVRSLLRNCCAPVLYLASTSDEVIDYSHIEEICTIAPKTQLAAIEGSHLALFTNPQVAVKIIVNFIHKQENMVAL